MHPALRLPIPPALPPVAPVLAALALAAHLPAPAVDRHGIGAPVANAALERPGSGDDLLEELRERLAQESPRTRRGAVREAARVGGREAWGLVLSALGDPEAEVGDAAQLAWSQLDDPRLAVELLVRGGLRAPDVGVRRRAAEALGRVRAEVDARALAERLGQVDDRARRLLVWSIERLARERRLSGDRPRLERALVKLQRSKPDPALAADALLALAAMRSTELERLAADARLNGAPELRAAALLAALEAPLPQREAWARALAGDREAGVRILAVEALERIGTRAAATTLVERLDTERNQRVRDRVLSALQSISGRKHRFDPRPWHEWLAQCPEDWLAGARARPDPVEAPTRARGLATLDVRGERVCFLFDFSGSMWEELPDGRTPKDVVDAELRTALERLPEETEFNLVPYGHHPEPWRDRVVSARRQNVRAALDFFEGCRLRGRGNVWEALELALSDAGVDTIVVLTDGYPTGGFHADMELIVPLFAHANRYRRLTVDAILVDASHTGVRHWTELALASGGSCTEVALRR